MPKYRLSSGAQLDLFDIAVYGETNFGEIQSDKYKYELKLKFQEIANNPLLYPIAETKSGIFRKCSLKAHAIYYTILDDVVLIVRIIGAQDF